MSSLLPRENSHAVKPFTPMPTAATTEMVRPATVGGSEKRCTAASTIAPSATSSNSALNSAARIVDPFKP